MFAIINKRDYWTYLDSGAMKPLTARLKDIQDAFVLYELRAAKGKKILELGGGNSRILPVFKKAGNECWNIDKFEGAGAGPVKAQEQAGVKIIRSFMGDFSKEIPDNSFDYVVSVSAVEHIPNDRFADAMKDCVRVLKPGGTMFHAVDLYLMDKGVDHQHARGTEERIKLYLSLLELTDGIAQWLEKPEIDSTVRSSGVFAANHCDELYTWNRIAPQLKDVREVAMSCSLRMAARKATSVSA